MAINQGILPPVTPAVPPAAPVMAPATQAAAAPIAPAIGTAPEADLTSARLTKLLDPAADNIYLQQAEQQGIQGAQARGLLNTTMAVQAAEGARIKAAAPLAAADASALERTRLANLQYEQEAGVTGAGLETQVNLANLGAAETRALTEFNATAAIQRDFQEQAATEGRARLSEAGAITRSAMAAADAATQTYEAAWQAIQMTPTAEMPDAVKTTLLAQLDSLQQQRLNAINILSGVTLSWV